MSLDIIDPNVYYFSDGAVRRTSQLASRQGQTSPAEYASRRTCALPVGKKSMLLEASNRCKSNGLSPKSRAKGGK